MNIATIITTRGRSCHVKTLHAILQLNIRCIQKGYSNKLIFVNDDPFEKSDMISNCIKSFDRIFFIDFGVGIDPGSLDKVVEDYTGLDVLIFPGVKEGIDWEMFKEKVQSKSTEPTHQMGLNFDTDVGHKISESMYKVNESSARAWMMICKNVYKCIKDKRTGNHKIYPKSNVMFEKLKESGARIIAFTGARLTFTYTHECISNILNSAGVKAT